MGLLVRPAQPVLMAPTESLVQLVPQGLLVRRAQPVRMVPMESLVLPGLMAVQGRRELTEQSVLPVLLGKTAPTE